MLAKHKGVEVISHYYYYVTSVWYFTVELIHLIQISSVLFLVNLEIFH